MKKAVFLSAVLMAHAFAAFARAPADIHDGQIVHALVAASSTVIESGTLARSRSSNQAVTAFADRLISTNTELSRNAIELLTTELKVTLQHNPLSVDLKTENETTLNELQTVPAEEFDRAFIDRTVVFYQNLLDIIDNQLMPAASSEKLKALLCSLFAPLSRHLEEAQSLQQVLHQPRSRNP